MRSLTPCGQTASTKRWNVGQALGLGAVFNRTTFDSTIKLNNIQILEKLGGKIAAPAWPSQVFGTVDADAAKRGTEVFERRCATCHYALSRVDDFSKVDEQTASHQDPRFPTTNIRTDARRALNFAEPVGNNQFNSAIADVLQKIIRRAGGTIDTNDQWRVTKDYAPRPLTGIWASPPYLHNGSVPTIYDLLLPAEERPPTFPLGHREYDPRRLGYTTDVARSLFTLDTSETGNSNAGHSGTM